MPSAVAGGWRMTCFGSRIEALIISLSFNQPRNARAELDCRWSAHLAALPSSECTSGMLARVKRIRDPESRRTFEFTAPDENLHGFS